ncbi:hypothetical protein KVR01_001473 [Diaporthe batatas]|uniref:uncharacterized protein n=1 Tax=Diaporthe batatas TaxID=748121 RepID=UPI001D035F48|nr:uncharacterized protein KVR01_001473 [Diaporthe batatas]KAG8168724.1 hypothetical protein KVR01_001473 [Diaporthe batatas]
MNYTYQFPQSPDETIDQLSRYPAEPDKSGQHNAGCLFVNRISEPWPHKYIKYVLMEWYIYRNENKLPSSPWDCPLPSCYAKLKNFRDVISHLEDCLKPNLRQYTCPDCHKTAQVPAAIESPGQKAMLKLTKSMDSIRDQFSPRSQPSSPGSSPTAASFSSNLSLTKANELASITSYCAEKPTCNPQDLGLSTKHEMIGSIKIDTQLRPPQLYDMCCELSGLTAATTSSYRSELPTPFSAHELPSASRFPHNMATPSESPWYELPGSDGPIGFPYAGITHSPSDGQHLQYGGFHHQSTCSDLQDQTMFHEGQPLLQEEHFLLEETANIQQHGANTEGMPGIHFNRDPNADYPDILQQFEHQIDDCFQSQRGSIFTNLHVGNIAGHQVLTPVTDLDSDFGAEFTSPTSPTSCANMSMAETLVASEGNPSPSSPNSTTTIDGQSSPSSPSSPSPHSCPKCKWSPDTTGGNRSPSKLRQAVEKHFKRNHMSQDHLCPACPQSFRNRPDNVKPHVKRKHPEVFMKLYGQKRKTAAAAAAQPQDQSWRPKDEGRAGSNIEAPVGKPAADKRSGRHARPPRGFARPEDQF